jgi:hypothetical protein
MPKDLFTICIYTHLQLIQGMLQCQAHLQRHSRHISHALHVYEVNHGLILDIVNTLKLRRQGMVKIYLH